MKQRYNTPETWDMVEHQSSSCKTRYLRTITGAHYTTEIVQVTYYTKFELRRWQQPLIQCETCGFQGPGWV